MTRRIRPLAKADGARVLEVCVAAFTPVHAGFEAALGPDLFALQYGRWREEYAELIAAQPVDDGRTEVHVLEAGAPGEVVGFIFLHVDVAKSTGELGLNAVHPAHQGQGHGAALYRFALEAFRRRGLKAAYVGTGLDAAHAPARAAYAKVGFERHIPTAHYFMPL